MNYLSSFRKIRRNRGISLTLIFTLFGWAFGVPFLITTSSASALTLVSATASSSAPSVSTNYAVQFTTANSIGFAGSASTTRITFDPLTNNFALASLATSTNDIVITRAGGGLTQVTEDTACSGSANEIYVDRIANNEPADYVEFRTCNNDTIAAGAITVTFRNAHVTNPSATGSYVVRINGTMVDSGDTRVAIIDTVTVTASVDTNLTFTIAGVASGTPVNGIDSSSTSTTATAIGFGSLQLGTSSMAAQQLTVSTNAANGFSVTVTENQDLSSVNGAKIFAFKDGNPETGTPTGWTAPSGTIGVPHTYGHMGLTSDDDTLSGGDEFGTSLYAGLTSTSTRTVMYHNGPADGSTQNVGLAKVLYRVQITALQAAATDYTNQLTYVCTPVF